MSGLVVEAVSLAVAGRTLLRDLSFRVEGGAALSILGPSGSGKSALLAFLGGHLDRAFAASGRVWLDGREVTRLAPERRGIGLMFQDDLLFPHLSVGDNVAFGLDPTIRGRAARADAVAQALREAGLEGFARRDPATLSGGQRARVALMRSLVAAPKALLLDEPFGKLDAPLRRDMRAFVFEHARRRTLPVVLVTHDPADARAAGGDILQLGAPTRSSN
ncbi:MAG: ATP-binding cassette domain-containing protein [Pseudomonadota bacterium]|nr:ATP-binding cassette domain-containing protein [Pseudomonadota bacterium]